MITLRPYQQTCLDDIRGAYRNGFVAPLLVSPTGSGKTLMFVRIVKGRVERGGRPMILAHRAELIDQIDVALREAGIVAGIISADYPESPKAQVQIASVMSLVRRLERTPAPDLIVIDEAHHCTPTTTWGKILAHYNQSWLLGVTATPTRLSGEGLDDTFDAMVLGPTTQQLIDQGYLSPVTVYAPPGPDLSQVNIKMGDYVKSELEAVMGGGKVLGDAVTHYRKHAHQLPAVAFTVSVKHAHETAAKFREGGYTSVAIDGSASLQLRRQIIADFRRGAINILSSCDLVSEGFDVPDLAVGILLRSTQSTGLYLQQCGRCLRPSPGKQRAIILDHAGNTARHGLPTDDREWTLAPAPIAAHSGDGAQRVAAVKTCPECFAANNPGRATCIECGVPFIAERKVVQVEGELVEVTRANKRRAISHPASDLAGLIQLGRIRGYRNPEGWAAHVWAARQRKRAERARAYGQPGEVYDQAAASRGQTPT